MNENCLSQEERVSLRKLVEAYGEAKVMHVFGVSMESILRALADRPMRRGTVVMLREGLKKGAQATAWK